MKSIDRIEKTNVVIKRSSKHLANKNSKKKKRDSWNNNEYLSSLILENYRGTKIGGFLRRTIGEEERRREEQGKRESVWLAQTLSLSVGSGSEAYPSILQCGEILIMRYYDKRRTIHPY